jgi:lauroyl/myristoyl acyltransferase
MVFALEYIFSWREQSNRNNILKLQKYLIFFTAHGGAYDISAKFQGESTYVVLTEKKNS